MGVQEISMHNQFFSMFNIMLNDNVKACELMNDGTYKRIKNKKVKMNSQEYFIKKLTL